MIKWAFWSNAFNDISVHPRAEQGITPSEAVPSLVDLEPAAGNDSNNTLIWTWHDNEPAAIAETTMTAEYKPDQIGD